MQKTHLSLLLAAVLTSASASSINLETITVTSATKSPQNLHNLTANIDVITSQEIEERGYQTISDALKTHAGISMTNSGGLGKATSIFVRGFDSKRVLVLVDGVRYNDPTSLSGAQFQHIMMGNVEKIEIIKGAQSGIWGADASAGVINIITKHATQQGALAEVFAEYGSYNTLNYGFNSSYKTTRYDLSLNAQRLTSDNFTAKLPKGANRDDLEDDAYENTSADMKVGVNLTPQDRVEAFFNYIDSDSDYDGYDKDPIKAANDPISNSSLTEKFYGLSYTRKEGSNSTKLYANRSDFSRLDTSAFSKSPFDGSVDEVGLNSAITYMKDGALSMGIDYKKFTHTLNLSTDFTKKDYQDKSYTNSGLFLTNSNTFSSLNSGDTIFSQALRYDNFDEFDNKFTYKLGVKQFVKQVEGLWFSANYATAYNTPSLYQLYAPNYGNANLNPEKTKEFDITANYQGLGITYFNNKIDDMIEYKITDFTTFAGGYYNIAGESTLKGLELTYSDTIEVANLAYNFNYTYLKAEDREGNNLPRRAKNSANLSLDYYGLQNTHLGTTISYTGKRTKSKYDADATKDYDAYTLVDIMADYDINKALNLYLKVNNALDKDYESVTGYATAERAFYVGFRYKIQ